jgi:hypothetical protein
MTITPAAPCSCACSESASAGTLAWWPVPTQTGTRRPRRATRRSTAGERPPFVVAELHHFARDAAEHEAVRARVERRVDEPVEAARSGARLVERRAEDREDAGERARPPPASTARAAAQRRSGRRRCDPGSRKRLLAHCNGASSLRARIELEPESGALRDDQVALDVVDALFTSSA